MTQDQGNSSTGGIAGAIARITAGLGRVGHDTSVRAGGESYTATSINAIADLLRPLIAAEGIAIIPAAVVVERHDEVTSRNGARGYHVVLRVTWTIARGGQEITAESTGASLDYSDKAYNKAHTFARKNLLVDLFNLSTGENPEAERPEAGHRERIAPSTATRGQRSSSPATPADTRSEAEKRAAGIIARGNRDGLEEQTIRAAVAERLGEGFMWPRDLESDDAHGVALTVLRELLEEIGAVEPAAPTGEAKGTGTDGAE